MSRSGYYDSFYHERSRGPDMSRRKFLKILVPGIAAVTAPTVYETIAQKTHIWPTFGELLNKLIPKKDQTPVAAAPKPPAATATPAAPKAPEATPRPQQFEQTSSQFAAGAQVEFSIQTGLPIRYRLPDGKLIDFTPAQITQFEALKQRAITSQEPDIAFALQVEHSIVQNERAPAPAHPLNKEKPADALTPEQLEKRGLQIIQTDDVKLHIRPAAFEKGALLEAFTEEKKHNMIVVLVDGPVVSARYLQDKKYDQVRSLLNQPTQTVADYKKQVIQSKQEELARNQQSLKLAITAQDKSKIETYQEEILSLKEEIYFYQNLYTDERILTEMSFNEDKMAGLHTSEGYVARVASKKFPLHTSVIFAAVGKGDTTVAATEIIIDGKGNFIVRGNVTSSGFIDLSPKTSLSHPSPDDFIRRPNVTAADKDKYPFGAQQPGQAWRHEAKHSHFALINTGEIQDTSEYATDIAAMETIRQAWDKWVASGYRDDSGYYFVFETPQGYVYTEKQPQESAPLPV